MINYNDLIIVHICCHTGLPAYYSYKYNNYKSHLTGSLDFKLKYQDCYKVFIKWPGKNIIKMIESNDNSIFKLGTRTIKQWIKQNYNNKKLWISKENINYEN